MSLTEEGEFNFGPFRLDGHRRSLTRGGAPISVGGRALDVLVVLVAAAGETVGKAALLDQVWPDQTVEENNLHVHISALRKVLGEGWIITVPGRGYRLGVPPDNTRTSEPDTGLFSAPLAWQNRPSIAVLAFNNMSGDPDQEYFSDGIADDIITELARSPSLFVIARNSSFFYKGRQVTTKQIAGELRVRYVLEGSVRRSGSRVRVTAQLIDAETGNHIWAERYDRALEDVFAVQDEIRMAVVRAILPAVADAEVRRALRKPPESLGAWEACQRGLWHMAKHIPADTEQAQRFFRRAIELDALLATPHALLACSHMQMHGFGGNVRANQEMAEVEARKAIALDPEDSNALATLSAISLYNYADYEAALEHADYAISVNPNDFHAYLGRARALAFGGRPAEAEEPLLTALRLSPRDPLRSSAINTLAVARYFRADYAEAAKLEQRAIRDYPGYPVPHRWLAASLGQLNRTDEAREALCQALAVTQASFDFFVRQRQPFFRPEDYEHMLDGLRKAGWQG
ncbi:MAG TPA: winged helix-turn-helix domain-containing tetratricopeptide repeat protein [Acetobacteraceae bacterium]|nr:winged helix-turn-helix domain-containing tetratricopeptide repeat protein [Acetobacteraceae bacterium]